MTVGRRAVRLLLVVVVLVACGNPFDPHATHLQLNTRSIDIHKTCVFSATHNCETAQVDSFVVWCNVLPGIFQEPDILVVLVPPETLEVTAKGVQWNQGKDQGVFGNGGVSNFKATQGADVDVTFPGKHRFSGTIRC